MSKAPDWNGQVYYRLFKNGHRCTHTHTQAVWVKLHSNMNESDQIYDFNNKNKFQMTIVWYLVMKTSFCHCIWVSQMYIKLCWGHKPLNCTGPSMTTWATFEKRKEGERERWRKIKYSYSFTTLNCSFFQCEKKKNKQKQMKLWSHLSTCNVVYNKCQLSFTDIQIGNNYTLSKGDEHESNLKPANFFGTLCRTSYIYV